MIDAGGMVAVGIYLLSLLVIGALARRARRETSLSDYYLAGSSLGVASLFFTLYATQYSGNSLFGVPGQAYREGFSALAVTFAVMGIVALYTVFAPALHSHARRERFVTAGDFVRWRFRNRPLLFTTNLIYGFVLTGYVLANLKAMGLLVEGATGGAISYAEGILLLSLVMAIYESLGGMRSVVWTDVLQGIILLAGCLLVFFVVWKDPDMGILSAEELTRSARETFERSDSGLGFVSLLLLVALGAAVYPHAIQRIYAARDVATLRISYSLMILMPLLVMLPLSLVAMSATGWLPPLSVTESERVILHTIDRALGDTPILSGVLVLFTGAAIAAIMSTVDSALLALGSIISNDMLGGEDAVLGQRQLHRLSRILSCVLMALMAALAIVLPQSIWTLMVLKFELLVQVAPTIVLGIRSRSLRAESLLVGMIFGSLTALSLKMLPGFSSLAGIHAGIWGLGANLLAIGMAESLRRRAQ